MVALLSLASSDDVGIEAESPEKGLRLGRARNRQEKKPSFCCLFLSRLKRLQFLRAFFRFGWDLESVL
jgi:hypothetical protein